MSIRDGIVAAIGHTPLIKLRRASEMTSCTILGKAEFMNPGQSVKDRPARQMILEAEKRGELKPGGLVVEGTAGNTGIGLALVTNARGYRTLIVIPDTQSQEKKDALRLLGAELVEVPALPYANPNTTISTSDAALPRRCAGASRTACCSPTNGTTWTTARLTLSRRARRSGSRRRAGCERLHRRRGHRRHAGGRLRSLARAEPGRRDR